MRLANDDPGYDWEKQIFQNEMEMQKESHNAAPILNVKLEAEYTHKEMSQLFNFNNG